MRAKAQTTRQPALPALPRQNHRMQMLGSFDDAPAVVTCANCGVTGHTYVYKVSACHHFTDTRMLKPAHAGQTPPNICQLECCWMSFLLYLCKCRRVDAVCTLVQFHACCWAAGHACGCHSACALAKIQYTGAAIVVWCLGSMHGAGEAIVASIALIRGSQFSSVAHNA